MKTLLRSIRLTMDVALTSSSAKFNFVIQCFDLQLSQCYKSREYELSKSVFLRAGTFVKLADDMGQPSHLRLLVQHRSIDVLFPLGFEYIVFTFHDICLAQALRN